MKVILDSCSEIPVKTLVFAGGEVQVRLEYGGYANPGVAGVRIETNISSSDKLMELLLVTDAVRRLFGQGHEIDIHLRCPYLPYARQDRVCYPGEALSLKVACDLINAQRYGSVEVWDCHSDVGLALLDRVIHVQAETLLRPLKKLLHEDTCLVAPDRGAVKRVSLCAKVLKFPMMTANKTRDPHDGAITGTTIEGMVHPKDHYLIVDDICDGGRTFIELAKLLRSAGAKHVALYVTHGIFSAGFADLAKVIDRIYVANPFPEPPWPDFVTQVGRGQLR